MAMSNQNVWYFILGGGLVGFWLFLVLFDTQGDFSVQRDQWALWGMLGLAIAGAFYAGRLANEKVRVAIWITTGIFLGLVTAAALINQVEAVVATFVAGGGALLIAAGLPGNPEDERTRAEEQERRRQEHAQYYAYYQQQGQARQPGQHQQQWTQADDDPRNQQQQSVVIHRQP